jgi:hypothetical protein
MAIYFSYYIQMNPYIGWIHSRNTNKIKNHEALKMFYTTVKAAVLNLRYPFLPHVMQVAHYQQYVRSYLLPMTLYASRYLQHACMVATPQKIVRQEDNLN